MIYKILNKLNNLKSFPFYLISPLVYSIGDTCEQIIISSLVMKNTNKKIILLYPNFFTKFLKYKVHNKAIFNYLTINKSNQEKYNFVRFFFSFFMSIEFFLRRVISIYLNKILKFKLSQIYNFPFIGLINIYGPNLKEMDFEKGIKLNLRNLDIKLSERKKIFCKKILERLNINDETKIVCLHVRDGAYKNDSHRKSYRNSNIENYIELIKFLIKNHYIVIRLGDKPSPKLNFSDNKFIDYPYSDIKSDLMDLYLITRCSFFVATQSGLMETAYMFGKPVLTTNMCELFCSFPRKLKDRGIFKTIIDKKKEKKISITDYVNMSYKFHDPVRDRKDLCFKENSPEELYNAIVEYLDLINNENFMLSPKQTNFNNILKKRMKEMIYKNELSHKNEFNGSDNFELSQIQKLIMWNKSQQGALCNSYLKNYTF